MHRTPDGDILPGVKLSCFILVLLALLAAACQGESSRAYLERVLEASWQGYRQRFITPAGQVALPEEGGGAISEAQAYALLRAVWAGDEATFVRVYTWTRQHLSRERTQGDHLLSWRWGRGAGGTFQVIDANTATDADLDYALALLLASRRGWRSPPELPDYKAEASRVGEDLLAREVVNLPHGEMLLTPGNWHEAGPPYLLNPSYFSPATYQLLEGKCRARGAEGGQPPAASGGGEGAASASGGRLHRDTYRLLGRLSRGLEGQPGVGLFPDWCRVDARGQFSPAPGRETRFGWEAVRLPFRLALDALWCGEPQAARLLEEKFLPFFRKEWQQQGRLLAVYHYDGTPAVAYESPVLYAGVLAAALAAGDRPFAGELAQKILSFYREKDGWAYFEAPDNYYANNWAWLGLALYAGWVRSY